MNVSGWAQVPRCDQRGSNCSAITGKSYHNRNLDEFRICLRIRYCDHVTIYGLSRDSWVQKARLVGRCDRLCGLKQVYKRDTFERPLDLSTFPWLIETNFDCREQSSWAASMPLSAEGAIPVPMGVFRTLMILIHLNRTKSCHFPFLKKLAT